MLPDDQAAPFSELASRDRTPSRTEASGRVSLARRRAQAPPPRAISDPAKFLPLYLCNVL